MEFFRDFLQIADLIVDFFFKPNQTYFQYLRTTLGFWIQGVQNFHKRQSCFHLFKTFLPITVRRLESPLSLLSSLSPCFWPYNFSMKISKIVHCVQLPHCTDQPLYCVNNFVGHYDWRGRPLLSKSDVDRQSRAVGRSENPGGQRFVS